MTLGEVFGQLPTIMFKRYHPAFTWIPIANRVLGEIESISDHEDFRVFSPLAVKSMTTRYAFPSNVRKVRYVRYRGCEVPFDFNDGVIVLERPLQTTQVIFESDVVSFNGSDRVELANDVSGLRKKSMLIAPNGYGTVVAASGNMLELNGPLTGMVEVGDSVQVVSDYLMIEGQKRLRRFPTQMDGDQPVALLAEVPLPDEWSQLLLLGIRYYGELQTDERGDMVPYWGSQYELAKRRYLQDARTPRGDKVRQRPAGWPSLG